MRASFKSIATFLLIFIVLTAHGRQTQRNQTQMLRDRGISVGGDLTNVIMAFRLDVNGEARQYVADINTATRKPQQLEAAARRICADIGKLSMQNAEQLMEVFLAASNETEPLHSQELKEAIFGKTSAHLINLPTDKLLRYYQMVVGEETTTRKRYKAIFTDALLEEIRSTNPTGISWEELRQILTAVWSTGASSHSSTMISELFALTSNVVKARKDSLWNVGRLVDIYVALYVAGHAQKNSCGELLIERIKKSIGDDVYTHICLSLAFAAHTDRVSVYPDFKRYNLEKTQNLVSSDVARRLREARKKLKLTFNAVSYLAYKDKLSTVNVTFVIDVPDNVRELDVSHVNFDKSKLKAFQFGEQSQLSKVIMVDHKYGQLTKKNFAKYFGNAAQRNRFEIYALQIHYDHDGRRVLKTVDIKEMGFPNLVGLDVNDHVVIENREMLGRSGCAWGVQ